jgi:hypothetical protein
MLLRTIIPERFAIFSPLCLLPTLDPQLVDGRLQCHGMSSSTRCWSVVFEVFVHVTLWSLVLASVDSDMLYGSVLPLVLGTCGVVFVWPCSCCRRFPSDFLLKIGHSLLN